MEQEIMAIKTPTSAVLLVVMSILLFSSGIAYAQTLEELQQSLSAKTEEIKRLEEESKKFREEVTLRQERGKTLHVEIKRITSTIAKLKSDISLTQKKIEKKGIEIAEYNLKIKEKELKSLTLRTGLRELILSVREHDERSVLTALIANKNLSRFFQESEYATQTNERLVTIIDELKIIKTELSAQKAEAEKHQEELEKLSVSLKGSKSAQESVKKEQADLLSVTRNEEKKYQVLLKDREAKRRAVESEVDELQEQIRIVIDRSRLPRAGRGVLGAPLPDAVLVECRKVPDRTSNCITQYYGYTDFARSGAYKGRGHDGVDFRAPVGTPVYAMGDGVIVGSGNTDIACRGAAWGNWVLAEYPNGLSSVFGHMSAYLVRAGDRVKRGQQIGISGNTGYSTGPHLHVGVFASQGIGVRTFYSKTCRTNLTMPVAPANAYLNPMDYL